MNAQGDEIAYVNSASRTVVGNELAQSLYENPMSWFDGIDSR